MRVCVGGETWGPAYCESICERDCCVINFRSLEVGIEHHLQQQVSLVVLRSVDININLIAFL